LLLRAPEEREKGFDSTEEIELLRRAGAGDEAAVRALFRTHVGRIHRTVGRILGPSDPDVEDVVQHVFLAALAGADGFDGRSSVSTWILGIATRRALDQARSRFRRNRFRTITELVGLGQPAPRPDVRHQALDLAHAALAELHPDQRTVFVLHEVEGYTLQEIKDMTGVGISTLHARLKAAKKKLDAIVGERDDANEAGGGDDGAA
jgi:RNA polymerase sigma-70 factor (ECF subfamily)